MIMEALVDDHTHMMVKGKRTKRQRQPSPLRFIMPSSSSSVGRPRLTEDLTVRREIGSPTTSSATQSNVEDEDQHMANCLILLAQGRNKTVNSVPDMASPQDHKPSGSYVYECKTCNRCFPSFQALGGHRASHKKHKLNEMDNKEIKTTIFMENENMLSIQMSTSNMSRFKATKVHECSICGADFSSGQALGGHMRRHRTFVNNNTTVATTTTTMTLTTITSKRCIGTTTSSWVQSQEIKKDRNVLELDLNLPAPEDCDQIQRESKFSFASKEQVLIFSASPLVDCHY